MTWADEIAAKRGDWLQTYTGRAFWPLDPRPEDVDLLDIAASLARQARYNGHTARFYSVAEHSLLISRAVPAEFALWGLMHDAAEAYLGDVITPVKRLIPDYKALEAGVMAAICARFGLSADEPDAVKQCDRRILTDERQCLMPHAPMPWREQEPALGVRLLCLAPDDAMHAFLRRFIELKGGA